ncbi:cobalt ECF transporter T component CbiQ [Actinopolymorpha rutila]|uniref:Cobalt/nickel transport system permease protein n=1 Tax=Actinopolymorpha rutila TaxID=446787 RepID=A0A852ZHU5_9ACTN|nr:cobalt/nickel transport system permease protein [Actinopolymorpha rutila]
MAAGHTHLLHLHGHSPVHRLPAHCKLVALVTFVLVVVATPRTAFWAFAGYAVLLLAVAAVGRVPLGFLARRVVVETPVIVFAVLLPFIAQGPRVDVAGLAVSQSGLWSAWNVLAKATLGVVGSILLAATTDQRDLLAGLQRLRLPGQLVQIATFMVRYLDVITGQLGRMRIARAARGFEPRGPRSWPVLARSAGTLFIRSYERGERVHLAMLSRGYAGSLPVLSEDRTPPAAWAAVAVLPLCAFVLAVGAWWTS